MVSTRFEVSSSPPVRYPKSIFFIISNEFSERFNYYGMRTVLALYLTQKLNYDDDTATVIYHIFTSLAYFFPLMGAILADSWLGKFKTIFYLSIVYCIGSTLIALGAIPPLNLPATSMTVLGLLFIAVGSGGIKPCVSAFGGDQFKLPEQAVQLAKFFSLFYFAINAGSLISTSLTPILREDVHCFNDPDCFSLAFGVPAVLMILSILVFVCGKSMYTIKKPAGNMVVLVFKCIGNAVSTRMKEKEVNPRSHWLDYAETKYGRQIIADIKSLMKILVLYIPLPVFWALFDQQGSRWTFQATRMNGEIGAFTIKPDQMQVINPLLILAFIPFFEGLVYPILEKLGIKTPLQKLTFGGILAGAAFVLSGFVEIALDKTNAVMPAPTESQLRIYNGLPCDYHFKSDVPNFSNFTVQSLGAFEAIHVNTMQNTTFRFSATTNETFCTKANMSTINGTFYLQPGHPISYFINQKSNKVNLQEYTDSVEKDKRGLPRIRILANIKTTAKIYLKNNWYKDSHYNVTLNKIDQISVADGEYDIFSHNGTRKIASMKLELGGVYTIILHEVLENEFTLQRHIVTPSNSLHMLWLVPQYVVITAGEVMFSITGLQFSYSQAPESMKSVIQAFWLLTVAFGNMLVVFIAEAKFVQSQSVEFFLFAILMFLDMALFMILATRYKYADPNQDANGDVETGDIKKPEPLDATPSKLDQGPLEKATAELENVKSSYTNEAYRED